MAAPEWGAHIEAIASGILSPQEVEKHIEAIKGLPPDPTLTADILKLLDAYGSTDSRPISTRIAAIQLLDYRGSEAPIGPLLAVALGGRDGRMPPEPDIYEGAIEALLTYPQPALRGGIKNHLAPHILQMGTERLITNWAQAILPHGSPLVDTLRAHGTNQEGESLRILAPILEMFHGRERTFIQQMRSAEGAILWRLALAAEALVLANWIEDDSPEIATLGVQLAIAIGRERPGSLGIKPIQDALGTLIQREEPIWAESIKLAQTAIPMVTLDSSHQGLFDINEGICPTFAGSLFGQTKEPRILSGDGPNLPLTRQPEAWLGLGVSILLLSLWIGVRRHGRLALLLATQGMAAALLIMAEGLLGMIHGQYAAEARPLFTFVDADLQSRPPFKETSLSGEPHYVSAQPWVRYQAFEQSVPDGGLRVALLGASSIHAPHYTTDETLTPRLKAQLERALPGRNIEVINAALEGTISYGVLRSGIYAMDAGAQLLVVYYGHNEVSRFLSLAQYEGFDPRITMARVLLNRSALFSALLPLTSFPKGGGDPISAQPKLKAPNEETLKAFRSLAILHFKQNISRLLEIAAERGVGVMMVSPIGNLSCSRAITKFSGTEQDVVISRRADAMAMGGSPKQARDFLQLRCDQALMGGEVHGEILDAHRSLADDFQIPLLSGEDILYGAPEGTRVKDLFWDNLHPTPLAYDLLAKALGEAIPPYLEDRGQ